MAMTREQLKGLARGNYADYTMGDPFSDDSIGDYESSLSTLTPEEREIYEEVSEELRKERAAKRR